MKIIIGIFLLFCFSVLQPTTTYALAGNASAISAIKTNKKDRRIEKKQERKEKRIDRLAKLVHRATGMSEERFKELSVGGRIGLIVGASVLTALILVGTLILIIRSLEF